MAEEIDRKEVGIILMAEVALQSSYLAGRADEHHFPTLLEELLCLAIGVLNAALQVFAAHHGIDTLYGIRIYVVHLPCLVVDGTKDHAALRDDLSCQGKEHATRGTVHTLLLVAVLCSQHGDWRYFVLRTKDRAYILAQSALNADALVYLGIEKSFAILTQSNAFLGTTLHARGATATFIFSRNESAYQLTDTHRNMLCIKNAYTIKEIIEVSDLGENGLKGKLSPSPGQKRVMFRNAFALSARILATSFPQGVALG